MGNRSIPGTDHGVAPSNIHWDADYESYWVQEVCKKSDEVGFRMIWLGWDESRSAGTQFMAVKLP